MPITTKAIVLTSLKYGDTSLIVRAFTASDGMKSYLLKGVMSSKKRKLKSAYFQPLAQLEIVADHKNKGTLERIREARIHYAYQTVHSDMAKNATTLFLAETLGYCIREEERNQGLFEFLEASLQWLDTHSQTANFHCHFLIQLTKYLGFYPDTSDMHASCFDLMEGEFTDTPSLHPVLTGENLGNFKSFMGMHFDAIHTIKMNKTGRRELLQSLVLYFELHLQGFRKPKSLAVLNEVFG
ncbi:DNA repair protein RecO [Pricia sp. S334]|uniref:DNA repair protein RecO n=1 Tax=Pricia mediterranea TaxID=3076079 RepID=A0ABU3L6W0_9FLAO|nr:DNA repair protein RecO [Pricia sp. S334]MDT7829066.1 DNA repair protein RecO [Pricia sp. S334]